MLGTDDKVLQAVAVLLEKQFGRINSIGKLLPFDRTTYYESEMGKNLVRRFVTFRELIDRNRLPGIKLWSNEVEQYYAKDHRRTVNLDPGYISAERLVLATGKNFTHRIHLGDGIFSDITLLFYKKSFRPLEWTYPDYADPETICMMNSIRADYIAQLRKENLL